MSNKNENKKVISFKKKIIIIVYNLKLYLL